MVQDELQWSSVNLRETSTKSWCSSGLPMVAENPHDLPAPWWVVLQVIQKSSADKVGRGARVRFKATQLGAWFTHLYRPPSCGFTARDGAPLLLGYLDAKRSCLGKSPRGSWFLSTSRNSQSQMTIVMNKCHEPWLCVINICLWLLMLVPTLKGLWFSQHIGIYPRESQSVPAIIVLILFQGSWFFKSWWTFFEVIQ